VDLTGKKILVVGAGISGNAAAKVAKRLGAEVTLSDMKSEDKLAFDMNELREAGVTVVLGPQEESLLEGVDSVIASPAVPVRVPLLQAALQKGIEVISEVEFSWRLAQAPFFAVTGTNGKTTTTTLLGLLMETIYPVVGVGGNIGTPLCEETLRAGSQGCIVAEISSYQMEASDKFCPKISAILNVTPDHVVRHGNLEVYQAMKEKIFAHQNKENITVLNYDNEPTRGMAERVPGQVCFFSRLVELEEGAFVQDGWLVMRWQGKLTKVMPVSDLKIKGAHNVENALAAMAVALLAGGEAAKLAKVMAEFPGVEHRIEPVKAVNGVMYYNDSKATNTDSSIKALESFEGHIILLAGGDDKLTDLTEFMTLVKERVDELILVGDAAARFKQAAVDLGYPAEHIHEAGYDMGKAVAIAHELAAAPQLVLLSPACASFDMFTGFEERGRVFKELVNKL